MESGRVIKRYYYYIVHCVYTLRIVGDRASLVPRVLVANCRARVGRLTLKPFVVAKEKTRAKIRIVFTFGVNGDRRHFEGVCVCVCRCSNWE